MDVALDNISRFRRNLALARKGAWILLAVSIVLVIMWEFVGGPHPENFGYRFSPMYSFSVSGFFFWFFVALVLIAIVLINYLHLGINVQLQCPQCQHRIPSKDEWVCAHCGTENRPLYGGARDSYYTLLTECKNCHRAPEALKCEQCGAVTAFGPEADSNAHAYKNAGGREGEGSQSPAG